MARKDNQILPQAAEADLDLASSNMMLDEEEGEEVSQNLRPQVTITQGQHSQIIAFLEKYGIDTDDMSPDEAVEKYNKIQGLVSEQAQVLSRGPVHDGLDRLLSHVPKGFRGEFFHDSSTDMDRARALGWVPFESKEANLKSPTGKADGLVRLGDLVLFIIPEEEYAAKQIARDIRRQTRRDRRKKEESRPSQGSAGIDPMDGKLGAHPDHPIRPLSELRG
jgi:hypothetical protein